MWQEKYRPTKISDMVGDFKIKITKYLENPSAIPHFLFYSKNPGCGKTSLAKCIIKELGCDYLILNSSDDRKIEVIRERVKEFAITKSSNGGRKCCILDEFDGCLKTSQEALRNIFETYNENIFFILTANNINKVIEPIQSRCVMIEFSSPNREEIYVYLEKICLAEKLDYTEDGIKELINLNYPSIRNCVKCLQDLHNDAKPVLKENIKPATEYYDTLWQMLLDRKWLAIKEVVMNQTVDVYDLNKFFWSKAVNLPEPNIKVIQICCRNERDFSYGCDACVVFVTSLLELVK